METLRPSLYRGLTPRAAGVDAPLYGATALEIRKPGGAVLHTSYYHGLPAGQRLVVRAQATIDSWPDRFPSLFKPGR